MSDTLEKPFVAVIDLVKAVEDANGDWVVSGPIASGKDDYDGEKLEPSGILKGMQMFFKLNAHVDYAHQYLREKNPKFIIGKGMDVTQVDGVPWLTVKLLKGQALAQDVWRSIQNGVHMGFSLQGLAKRRNPRNHNHVLETEIHLVTIDPSPKGFDQFLQVGPSPAAALAKSLMADVESEATNGWLAEGSFLYKATSYAQALLEQGLVTPKSIDLGSDAEKAVALEAKHSCPTCGSDMYCLKCHTDTSKKAMTTGEGVVDSGATGGASLREQELRGAKTCRKCGKAHDRDGTLCAECETVVGKALSAALRKAGALNPDATALSILHDRR